MPYRGGLCGIGAHEGTAPRNINGNAIPTCQLSSNNCDCACHLTYDEMFRLTEMDRKPVDNSGYVPDHGDFVSLSECRRLSVIDGTNGAEYIESQAPDRVPATIVKPWAPTPTGVSAKGELEAYVDEVCTAWAVDQDGTLCTPAYISKEIAKSKGIREPSVGAIGAVFDRWVKLGYALCARKPVRFMGYSDRGREVGLSTMKADAKRKEHMLR